MYMTDIIGWHVDVYEAPGWGPNTRNGDRTRTIAENGGSLELTDDDAVILVPLSVLANHLRLMGWTVTPPEEASE